MEHPLDLSSQTEMDATKSYECSESETETVCQFQNCSCPKKHLTVLESPKVNSQHKNITHFGYSGSHMPPMPPMHQHVGGGYKRLLNSDTNASGQCHPKRRKMERIKHTLGKSSSDPDLESHDAYQMDQELAVPPQQAYSHDDAYGSSHNNWERENVIRSSGDFYQKNREMDTPMYYDNPMANIWRNKETDQEQRERSKTVSHIERLPKKRAYARNFSQENNGKGATSKVSATVSRRELPSNQVIYESVKSINKRPLPCQIENTDSRSSDDSSGKQSPSSDTSGRSTTSQPERELTEKEKAYILLKADIISEIDNEKDKEEDVSSFRKNLFKRAMVVAGMSPTPSVTKPEKEVEENNEPGESRITALDYLMSKQLLETEDKAFKPRNHHIHEIINGEKPGQLCLMDIVELQVEVGLA